MHDSRTNNQNVYQPLSHYKTPFERYFLHNVVSILPILPILQILPILPKLPKLPILPIPLSLSLRNTLQKLFFPCWFKRNHSSGTNNQNVYQPLCLIKNTFQKIFPSCWLNTIEGQPNMFSLIWMQPNSWYLLLDWIERRLN